LLHSKDKVKCGGVRRRKLLLHRSSGKRKLPRGKGLGVLDETRHSNSLTPHIVLEHPARQTSDSCSSRTAYAMAMSVIQSSSSFARSRKAEWAVSFRRMPQQLPKMSILTNKTCVDFQLSMQDWHCGIGLTPQPPPRVSRPGELSNTCKSSASTMAHQWPDRQPHHSLLTQSASPVV